MEEQNNNGQLQIELREEVAQGTYANLAISKEKQKRLNKIIHLLDNNLVSTEFD